MADSYAMQETCKVSDGRSSHIFNGFMTFVMGIATMIRVTRNMPRRLTDANIYSSPAYCVDTEEVKSQEPSAKLTLSTSELMSVMKRMAELEEKVMNMKPTTMPPEKEEMLNSAVHRADALEQDLMATKKVNVALLMKLFLIIDILKYICMLFPHIAQKSDCHLLCSFRL